MRWNALTCRFASLACPPLSFTLSYLSSLSSLPRQYRPTVPVARVRYGYGEDLLDYNKHQHWMARIGYSIAR